MRKRLTRGEAIRQKCLDCSSEDMGEVRKCNVVECPLHPFRMGNEIKTKEINKSENIEVDY